MPDTVEMMDNIHELIERRELSSLSHELVGLPLRQLVDVFESLVPGDAAVAFRLLEKAHAVDVFDDLDSATQADLVRELGSAETTEIFSTLDPDEQARLFDELPARVAKHLLAGLTPEQREPVAELLGYPRHCVGRQMEPATLAARDTDRVEAVVARIRESSGDAGSLAVVPVVSRRRELVGMVDAVDLMRADPESSVADLMESDPDSATAYDDAEQVARRVLHSGRLVFPIVDRERRLIGVLPIGDAAVVEKKAMDEDQARAGGSEPLRRPYLLTSVGAVARARITWLLVLAVSAVLTVQVLDVFEDTLNKKVGLALFIPLLIGIGGNTGSQAATTVTRALTLGNVRLRDWAKVAFKELRTGMLLGLVLGLLAFVVASLIFGVGVGTVIGLTILFNCSLAATVGGLVPILAQACKVDPAVVSTPFIATFCDATGLLVYFSVAILVLGL